MHIGLLIQSDLLQHATMERSLKIIIQQITSSPKISFTWWTPELTCCWSPKECFIFFWKVVSFARTMVLILIRHRVAYFVGLSDCGSPYFPDMTSVNDQMWNPDIFICRQKIKLILSIFIYKRKDFEKKRQSTILSV